MALDRTSGSLNVITTLSIPFLLAISRTSWTVGDVVCRTVIVKVAELELPSEPLAGAQEIIGAGSESSVAVGSTYVAVAPAALVASIVWSVGIFESVGGVVSETTVVTACASEGVDCRWPTLSVATEKKP